MMIFAFICFHLLGAPSEFTEMKEFYKGIREIHAKFDQEKKAPYLKRPLHSEVQMSVSNAEIEWKILKPLQSTLRIRDGKIIGPNSKPLPQMKALVEFLNDLFQLKFESLEKVLDFKMENRQLLATTRSPELKRFFKRIEIRFARDWRPREFQFDSESESLRLRVLEFEVKR